MEKGQFVGIKEGNDTFVVKKTFSIKQVKKTFLRATALGLYFAEINGKRVGDCYLTPGWTSYNKMLQVQKYDVTSLIKAGENTISLTVNNGWYCGRLTWHSITDIYGEKSAVCAELYDENMIVNTDSSWIACESFIRASGIYDGERQDHIAEKKLLTVDIVPFEKNVLVEQICEPVRNIERICAKKAERTQAGEYIYDFGQNLTGVVEVKTPKDFDGTLTLQFAEILVNGEFYTENLRSAKATDTFRLKGERILSPEFTFHGFRYLKLSGAELPKESVTAIVRHTDMLRTGKITTSNARFNRLMDNIVWGQKDNFLDIPTDCPQRDERLGWTGDINAFCGTAAFNYDVRLILKKWLADVRNDQAETGEIPTVAPYVKTGKNTAAMWCDAITMVPWTLYRMYGDKSFLTDNISAMKKFLSAYEKTLENGLVARGHQYGDWLALDNEICRETEAVGRTDVWYIANVFYSVSLKIVADTAKILDDRDTEMFYRKKYEILLKNIQEEYFSASGRLAFDTVTAQVIALHFNVVPEKAHKKLAESLNKNVIKHGYCVTTGFIGTTYLLFALADNGYFETARRVILNNGYPGWFYEVDMGATTVWERWNSLTPDGTPNPDGMNSYNHYAYGSMQEFVYRRIAGIETIDAGFGRVKIAPMPTKGLPDVCAEYNSVKGKIIAGYRQNDNGKVVLYATVPKAIQAEFYLPYSDKPIAIGNGDFSFEIGWENLDVYPFTPESTVKEVFDNPHALKAFNEAFGGFFYKKELGWMCSEPKTLQFMAEFRDMENKMKLADFPEMLEKANKLFIKKEHSDI